MDIFEIIVGLLLAGAALTAVAKKIGAPYPALVALAGIALVAGKDFERLAEKICDWMAAFYEVTLESEKKF